VHRLGRHQIYVYVPRTSPDVVVVDIDTVDTVDTVFIVDR